MIKVYIAPHNMKRYNSGIMYDLALAIQNKFKNDMNVQIIIPEKKQAKRLKYDNIREAKNIGTDIYIELLETHILDKTPTMGIYYSKINESGKYIANKLDKELENILPFNCNHTKENDVDDSIIHFEYDTPSIIYYINHNRDYSDKTIKTINDNIEKLSTAFYNAINDIASLINKEKEIQSDILVRGTKIQLTMPNNGKIKGFSSLENASKNINSDYFVYTGSYVIYSSTEDCINISGSLDSPGIWIRKDELQ